MIQVYKESPRGDTVRWQFIVTYQGEAYDLTGCTIKANVKRKLSDADGLAVVPSSSVTIDPTDLPNGLITYIIASSVTTALIPGSYYSDIQVHTVAGDIVTPIRIMWELETDVIRTP